MVVAVAAAVRVSVALQPRGEGAPISRLSGFSPGGNETRGVQDFRPFCGKAYRMIRSSFLLITVRLDALC